MKCTNKNEIIDYCNSIGCVDADAVVDYVRSEIKRLGTNWQNLEVWFNNVGKYCFTEHISRGYRKCTTGEYVPNAYRRKFGWKNTYYQPSKTIIEIGPERFRKN